ALPKQARGLVVTMLQACEERADRSGDGRVRRSHRHLPSRCCFADTWCKDEDDEYIRSRGGRARKFLPVLTGPVPPPHHPLFPALRHQTWAPPRGGLVVESRPVGVGMDAGGRLKGGRAWARDGGSATS